jgi:hypothetical protein
MLLLSIENKFAIKLVKTNADYNPMPVSSSENFHQSDYLLVVKGVREI